jgi:hypothetical protein
VTDAIGRVVFYGALTRTALEQHACVQAVAGAIETARATGVLQAHLDALAADEGKGGDRLGRRMGEAVRDLGHDVIAACAVKRGQGKGEP